MERYVYILGGQVQGVGFRPFVFRLAQRLGLTGTVGNTTEGVRVEIQGAPNALLAFDQALNDELPPLARITTRLRTRVPVRKEEKTFRIVTSTGKQGNTVLVSPDVSTCDHCLAEIHDPANRRYGYPFTNCTDCGPRYTITRSLPYDRATTSMNCFPMCPDCQTEYDNPTNRRFHAQPNACPVCGPRVWLTSGRAGEPQRTEMQALEGAAHALATGSILAVKGLGGFHLVCNATDGPTVERLRQRKRRPHKALAVMVPDVETAHRLAHFGPREERLLTSIERPIVILSSLPGVLPSNIAPDLDSIGVMLPYTPLHHLLLGVFANISDRLPVLVMTSGNAGGLPIELGNRQAIQRLQDIADGFLLHNRDILVRADDSVVCSSPAEESSESSCQFFRRARGFVPYPLSLPSFRGLPDSKRRSLLATGGELKNTLCLTRNREAFVSQHIGDLHNLETYAFFREMISHLSSLLEITPEIVVCDLHPDYLSTGYALESGLPVFRLQHHFAHLFGVLGEHGHTEPALGLILDGTGYGTDNTFWGGELLLVTPETLALTPHDPGERLGRLAPFPLPGGEAAIREPWRLVSGFAAILDTFIPLEKAVSVSRQAAVTELVRAGKTFMTSSCGRLFDAVSALLGLCASISYEGQAAIRLEQAQTKAEVEPVSVSITRREKLWELDTGTFFLHLLERKKAGEPVSVLARQFHLGLVEGLADLALAGSDQTGVRTVAMGGGALHNQTLLHLLPSALARRGLRPLLPQYLPPGDGGLSFGQAVWATWADV